jgi:glycosyltransferase involved in cell wall biosynthesis
VIAYACGSVPEVVEDGLTGFIVRNHSEAIAAVGRLPQLSRRAIRQRFEERFSATAMAERYIELYRRLAVPQDTKLGFAAE